MIEPFPAERVSRQQQPLTTTSADQDSTFSAAPSFASAVCPLPPIPKLYDLSGFPHFDDAGGGGSARRSSTVIPRYPRLASMRATASPVGPPPTIAVDEGRRLSLAPSAVTLATEASDIDVGVVMVAFVRVIRSGFFVALLRLPTPTWRVLVLRKN